MNGMNIFKEMRETKPAVSDVGKEYKTKAFENFRSFNEVKDIKDLHTINESLEGKKYPGTEVKYERRTIEVNGEKCEGVFPKFESKFDVKLPPEMRESSDVEQFKYCTQKLKEKIENDPEFAKQFTPRQIEQIKNGEPRISGLTWHHNEETGKIQLVNADDHSKCRHTGGRSIWGGGSERR